MLNKYRIKKDAPLEVLKLTAPLHECLTTSGITTVCELSKRSQNELKDIIVRGANNKNKFLTTEHAVNIKLQEIDEKLASYYFRTAEGKIIESMQFTARTYNCLKRNGIDTMEELDGKTDEELLKIQNLGMSCLKEVRKKQMSIKREKYAYANYL